MTRDPDVQRLESERLRPMPPDPSPADLWRELFDLITGECRRAGYLPLEWRRRA